MTKYDIREVINVKRILPVEKKREVISLISGISYASVPFWFGSTMRNLKMDILTPKERNGHKACPAIIWICGGAYRVVDRSVWIPEMVYFAKKGYVVASIEYRTSNEAPFPAALIDGKAAVRYLKAHAEELSVDPQRICVMGESAGGTIASLIGVTGGIKEFDQGEYLQENSTVKAVVDFYGLVDFIHKALNKREDIPSWAVEDFLGENYTKLDAEKASAVCYVNDTTPPFLILHGNEDKLVPLSQSEIMYETLQKNNVDSEFYIIEGAEHGVDEFYQKEVLEKVAAFLERTV